IYEDVRKSGYLRKQKSMHRRFFVLRAASEHGPARLEYYENEKKFRSKSPVPKKVVHLEACFNINKRADSKNKHMIVLYTRGESFAVAADTEQAQEEWYQAIGGECGLLSPGPAFKEVWQVKLWPKGLGQARNLIGIYRLCLTDKTVNFVKLNSDVAAVVLQLMNVRRCGHSENFFFIEVGRSAMTGPGEFWMQVEDSVVAQNMHETLLEAMKALSEEFRQRSKTQAAGASCGGGTASNPISVPSRRHHPNLPPSQVGFSRRARTETPGVPHTPMGTVPICTYARIPQRISMSGSPSDYGSSDEYGSSPGEHSLLAAGLPAALVDTPAGCVLVGHRNSSHKRSHGRRILRRSSNRECEAERRLLSKEVPEDASIDSGYMSMLPGAVDEYMAMTPNNSVSPPQHIRLPVSEGYMIMSPNSSCSPDLHGMSSCLWGSRSSMESRAGSDYMNMSPISARSACSTPPSHPEQHPLQPKTVYSYFSLPRSYKHTTLSTRFEDDLGEGRKSEGVCRRGSGAGRRVKHGAYPSGDYLGIWRHGSCSCFYRLHGNGIWISQSRQPCTLP
uniref:Si:ch211-284e13.4 n=1 Tax=Astyanax mexicanus TaxID=7994 RepID=A0A3B1KHH4_ASTMX